VVWAAKGRSKDTVAPFFDALGERAAAVAFVTCDGAEWIRTVVAERAPQATLCLDTFHVISWATDALDEVRRGEWNRLRATGGASAAKQLKGLRWLLVRNWENLTGHQRGVIRDLDGVNRRLLRAWQLKEELREIFAESNNAAIGRLRTNARGFHDPQAFITMIMLDRAAITPDLPWATRS
jgi:transposase